MIVYLTSKCLRVVHIYTLSQFVGYFLRVLLINHCSLCFLRLLLFWLLLDLIPKIETLEAP